MQKKAISGIVTTMLIVLVSVAAVLIVWGVVKNMIQGTSDSITTGCIGMDLSITKCNITSSQVTVERGTGGGNMTNLIIKVTHTSGDSDTVRCAAMDILQTKTFNTSACIGSPKALADGDVVNVAAFIQTESGSESTCDLALRSDFACVGTVPVTPAP